MLLGLLILLLITINSALMWLPREFSHTVWFL
jgi:hypothetical protein